jgi:RNase P subunit RPR2
MSEKLIQIECLNCQRKTQVMVILRSEGERQGQNGLEITCPNCGNIIKIPIIRERGDLSYH